MGSPGGRADEQPRGQPDALARRPRHAGPADPGSYQPPDEDWSPAGGPPSARTGPTRLPPREGTGPSPALPPRGGPPRQGTGPSPAMPPRNGPPRHGTGPSPALPSRGGPPRRGTGPSATLPPRGGTPPSGPSQPGRPPPGATPPRGTSYARGGASSQGTAAAGVSAAQRAAPRGGSPRRRGPIRGYPPMPGQPGPVYPPGQFSVGNRPSVRASWLGMNGNGDGTRDSDAEPGYSILATSDPSADATVTQAWSVIDEAGSWSPPPPARDVSAHTDGEGFPGFQRAGGPAAAASRAAFEAAAPAQEARDRQLAPWESGVMPAAA